MNENPTTVLETKYGYFDLMYFEYYGTAGVIMSRGDVSTGAPLLRIHSSCLTTRSEERRVGKECRSRWSPYH